MEERAATSKPSTIAERQEELYDGPVAESVRQHRRRLCRGSSRGTNCQERPARSKPSTITEHAEDLPEKAKCRERQATPIPTTFPECAEDLHEGPVADSVRQHKSPRPSLNAQRTFASSQLPRASSNIETLDRRRAQGSSQGASCRQRPATSKPSTSGARPEDLHEGPVERLSVNIETMDHPECARDFTRGQLPRVSGNIETIDNR